MKKNFNEVINNLKSEIMNSIDVEFAKYNKEKIYLNIPISNDNDEGISEYLCELTKTGNDCQFIPKYIEKVNVENSEYNYCIIYDRVIWDNNFENCIKNGEHTFYIGMFHVLSSIDVYNAIYNLLINEHVKQYNSNNN